MTIIHCADQRGEQVPCAAAAPHPPQYQMTSDWPDGATRPPDGPHWWRMLGRHDGLTGWVMVDPPPPGAAIERWVRFVSAQADDNSSKEETRGR